jgi:predicted methyltransferase
MVAAWQWGRFPFHRAEHYRYEAFVTRKRRMRSSRIILGSWLLLACGAAQPPSQPVPASVAPTSTSTAPQSRLESPEQRALTVVASADRSEADRALDAGRKPAELLTFTGVAPGMRAADVAAGGGYTAELLARAVGSGGTVYGQNSKFVLGFAEAPWSARLATPAMKHAVRLDRELDEPFPPDVKELDLVTMVLFYHDTVWLETDRARMNAAIFTALKPGGHYVVLDHSAKPGDGLTAVKSLHRIEESIVKEEIQKAGFVLEAESDAWREPSDTRDWSASPRTAGEKRGHSDRFALRFKKP